MTARAGDVQQQLQETTKAVEIAREKNQQQSRDLAHDERDLTELTTRLDRVRLEYEAQRSQHVEEMRAATTLLTEIGTLESQALTMQGQASRSRSQIAKLGEAASQLASELKLFHADLRRLESIVEVAARKLREAQATRLQRRRQLTLAQKELADVQARHTAAHERFEILQELENRREGLSSGVRQALAEAKQTPAGPFRQIRGLVADVIQVEVEMAPLIDAVLGPASAHLVVAPGNELFELLKKQSYRFDGRVGFVSMQPRSDSLLGTSADLSDCDGVVGRAIDHVKADESFNGLLDQLLGTTWIVENLERAFQLADEFSGKHRLVTLAGEVVEADGTVVVGPNAGATGLISRRSELRALGELKEKLGGQLEEGKKAVARLEQAVQQSESEVDELDGEKRHADQQWGQLQIKVQGAQQRCDQMEQQLAGLARRSGVGGTGTFGRGPGVGRTATTAQ